MRAEAMHQAGRELLDALEARLGWRPTFLTYEEARWPWFWRTLWRVFKRRSLVLGRRCYVADPDEVAFSFRAISLIGHEGTHWLRRGALFYGVYFLQQIVILLALAAVVTVNALGYGQGWEWAIPLACLAVPWPAPNRAMLEAEAYAMNVRVLRYCGVARREAIALAVSHLAHVSYWMTPWPFERLLRRAYHVLVLQALAKPRTSTLAWARDVEAVATRYGVEGIVDE